MRIINPVKVGDVFESKWGTCSVIEYNYHNNIIVEFLDGTKIKCAAKELKSGKVKNRNLPHVHGVGFVGYGRFKPKIDGKNTPEYDVWNSMIKRCYNTRTQVKQPTYVNCTVSPEWFNFQIFAEWYVRQRGYSERWQLDKDLLVIGNTEYSSDKCTLVPPHVNALFSGANIGKRGEYPRGVHLEARSGLFIAQIHRGGVAQDFLGRHKTPEEAFAAYKTAKEKYVKEIAEKYKEDLNPTIYSNLINYNISITD